MADATQGTGDVISRVTGRIDFHKIIGVPFAAIVEAANNNAKLYMQFIHSCLDKDGKPIIVPFARKIRDEKGNETYKIVEVPLLAIVQHPSMVVDKFSNTFTIEISDSFTQDVHAKLDGKADVSLGWGPFKVSVGVNFSASYQQTRKTDTRAKQEVIVEAHQGGMTEGMHRVIDWLTSDLGKTEPSHKTLPPANDSDKGKKAA